MSPDVPTTMTFEAVVRACMDAGLVVADDPDV